MGKKVLLGSYPFQGIAAGQAAPLFVPSLPGRRSLGSDVRMCSLMGSYSLQVVAARQPATSSDAHCCPDSGERRCSSAVGSSLQMVAAQPSSTFFPHLLPAQKTRLQWGEDAWRDWCVTAARKVSSNSLVHAPPKPEP